MPIVKIYTLLNSLYGHYKRYVALLLFLGLLGGLLETLGISILIPLFSHVLQMPIAGTDSISHFFNWFFDFLDIELKLRFLLPLIVFVFLLRACVLFLFDWIRITLSSNYEKVMRADLYRALLSAPWRYLSRQKIGFAENTLMIDVTATTRLLMDLTNAMLHGSSLVVYATVAIIMNPFVAIVTLIGGIIFFVLFQPLFARTRRYAKENIEINKKVAHDVNESVLGMKTIKALGAENILIQQTVKIFEKLRAVKVRQILAKSATTVAIQPMSILFVLGIFVVSFLSGEFNFAVFAVTIFLIDRIFVYVDRMQNLMHIIADALPYGEHVLRVRAELAEFTAPRTDGVPFLFSKDLAFHQVSFAYDQKQPVLSAISFSIPRGSFFAVVGASGAGKTTLVDLMLRLLSPRDGSITIDGVSIADVDLSLWHAKVGYVAQEPFLMNATIEENIRFYDQNITDEDIAYAIRGAHLTDVVAKLPNGINSNVGERGTALSGGERQRVALARVLARRPELLILDEPTSALDATSERVIREALLELKGSITIVIIAHKIDTIKAADMVMVLSDGQVVEQGIPSHLAADSASQYSRFFKGEENTPVI